MNPAELAELLRAFLDEARDEDDAATEWAGRLAAALVLSGQVDWLADDDEENA